MNDSMLLVEFFLVVIFGVAAVNFAFRNRDNFTNEVFKPLELFGHATWRARSFARPLRFLPHIGIVSSSTLATALTLGAQTPSFPVSGCMLRDDRRCQTWPSRTYRDHHQISR